MPGRGEIVAGAADPGGVSSVAKGVYEVCRVGRVVADDCSTPVGVEGRSVAVPVAGKKNRGAEGFCRRISEKAASSRSTPARAMSNN